VLEEGRTGLLVPKADPERLASGLKKLLSDDLTRGAMGTMAREAALVRFSLQAMVERYEAIYEAVSGFSEQAPHAALQLSQAKKAA
jgi:glycosyltransferase involved in cell wall biosynthesis